LTKSRFARQHFFDSSPVLPNDRRIVYEGPHGGIFVMNANGARVRS
jgi:hypothetical protein